MRRTFFENGLSLFNENLLLINEFHFMQSRSMKIIRKLFVIVIYGLFISINSLLGVDDEEEQNGSSGQDAHHVLHQKSHSAIDPHEMQSEYENLLILYKEFQEGKDRENLKNILPDLIDKRLTLYQALAEKHVDHLTYRNLLLLYLILDLHSLICDFQFFLKNNPTPGFLQKINSLFGNSLRDSCKIALQNYPDVKNFNTCSTSDSLYAFLFVFLKKSAIISQSHQTELYNFLQKIILPLNQKPTILDTLRHAQALRLDALGECEDWFLEILYDKSPLSAPFIIEYARGCTLSNFLHRILKKGDANILEIMILKLPKEELHHLLSSSRNWLYIAAVNGHVNVFEVLLRLLKEDFWPLMINKKGPTALHLAAGELKNDVFKFLIDSCLENNLQLKDLIDAFQKQDKKGRIFLHDAAFVADSKKTRGGIVSIFEEVKRLESEDFINLLSIQDEDGDTALHVAAA